MPWLNLAGVPLAQLRFARALKKRGHHVEFIIGKKDSSFSYQEIPGVTFIRCLQPFYKDLSGH